jgi:hypothetical protein
MNVNIRLIIPNTVTVRGDELRADVSVGPYLAKVADIAGGFTAWRGTGGQIDPQGALIVEPVTIVECSCEPISDTNDPHPAQSFRRLAQDIAIDLRQDCVYLAIDGVVEYIKP